MFLNEEKTLLLIEVSNKFNLHKQRIHQDLIKFLSTDKLDQVERLQSDLVFVIQMELVFIEKLSTMSDSAVEYYRKNETFQLEDLFQVLIGECDL